MGSPHETENIGAEDQARLIAAILAEPAEHIGKTYTLHGPIEMSQAEIAAAITEVIGRKITSESGTICLSATDFAGRNLLAASFLERCQLRRTHQGLARL